MGERYWQRSSMENCSILEEATVHNARADGTLPDHGGGAHRYLAPLRLRGSGNAVMIMRSSGPRSLEAGKRFKHFGRGLRLSPRMGP